MLVEREGDVTYDPRFLSPEHADRLLTAIRAQTAWRQDHLRVRGRAVPFPRLIAWYGDSGAIYRYSGTVNEPLPWTDPLAELRDLLRVRLGVPFNSVLANLYRSGADAMGWHADDEPELGEEPVIASVSLGAARRFQLKRRDGGELLETRLEHGSLLVMSGVTQAVWKHRVPRERRVSGARVNLTYRVTRLG